MKFDFKLERVLNYKKTVEDHKKAQYGTIRTKLNNEEIRLNNFHQYKNSLINEMNKNISKTKVGELAMYNNYINDLSKKITRQEEIVTETKIEAEEAKQEMIVAVQEKKIFEKLKENKYEDYLYQLKKDEEKQIDTIVSYKINTQQ